MTGITATTALRAHCAACKRPAEVPTAGTKIIRSATTVTADTETACTHCHTRVVIVTEVDTEP